MKNKSLQGRIADSLNQFNPGLPCRPNPIVTFTPVWTAQRQWIPAPGDKLALAWLRHERPVRVSFARAYTGWRASGAREEKELGEGRAFLRWLQKHRISVDWKERDFSPHPYFSAANSPQHVPGDEMAQGLSFAIQPVQVRGRNIKLYVQDSDMLSLLHMPYGEEEDFLELIMRYVAQRFQWEEWRAPAPCFLDWVTVEAKRPVFKSGQLGFRPLYW